MIWIQSNEFKLSNLQHDLPNDKCNLKKNSCEKIWSIWTNPQPKWPDLWSVVTRTRFTRPELTQSTRFATSNYICVLNLAIYNYIYFAEAHKYINDDDGTKSLTCWIVLILVIWYTHFMKALMWIKETDERNRRAYEKCSGTVRPMNDTRENIFSFSFSWETRFARNSLIKFTRWRGKICYDGNKVDGPLQTDVYDTWQILGSNVF